MKIEAPFTIDEVVEFRFVLSLESKSVEAHSLMSSNDNAHDINESLRVILDMDIVQAELRGMLKTWEGKHK